MSTPESTGNAAFIKAATDAKSLPKTQSNDQLLQLYAHFKQSIFGDNDTPRPGMMDFTGKAKHDAWTGLKGMSKESAQAKYIEIVTSLQ